VSRRFAASFALCALVLVGTSAPVVAAEGHHSIVTLKLSGALIATGEVNVQGFTRACEARRDVLIKHRSNGTRRTVATKESRANGTYRTHLPMRAATTGPS
jgi:hypothetical protein